MFINCLPQARHCHIFSLHYCWAGRGLDYTPFYLYLSSEAIESQTQELTDGDEIVSVVTEEAIEECDSMRPTVPANTPKWNGFQTTGPSHGGER